MAQHRSRVRVEGFAPVPMPEQARAFAELGRSSATSPHADRRARRARTRATARGRALRDWT